MKMSAGTVNALWMGAGAVFLAAIFLTASHFYEDVHPAELVASKAGRVDLVNRMRLGIASASDLEKSAVMASTEKDSRDFADQARAATAAVERDRAELASLLETRGTGHELDLLARFSEDLDALRRVDDDVLRLAVENSNVKAYALLYGPAAEVLAGFDAALARVLATRANPSDGGAVDSLAFGARIGILRIQTLLAPHIAEEDAGKMDRMEAAMAREEEQVRRDLDALGAVPGLADDADRSAAASLFERYVEVKRRILALSRENTNVRSLTLSLNQKRKAMALCLESLGALEQAIVDEPIRGVTYGRAVSPR